MKNKTPRGSATIASVDFPDSTVLQNLVGEKDQHLKLIERRLEVKIGRNQKGFVISGQDADVALASDLLEQLRELLQQGGTLYADDIERAVTMLSGNRKLKLSDLLQEQITIAGKKRSIVPKTFVQKQYLEAIKTHDIVFGVGPAGTGKTYLAMAMAVSALMKKKVKRVVLCRPAVEAGERLGFLPGDLAEKVNPYLRPLYDALHDMVEYEKARDMVERGLIEVAPLAFMRGRTLSRAFVILDEAQNTSRGQMKMLLTRLGPESRCVITGDDTQIDLPPGIESGLSEAIRILAGLSGVAIVNFTSKDVMRHPLVSEIVRMYKNNKSPVRKP